MPDLSAEETAATQSTNDSEVGLAEEAIVVEGASVDPEGAEETSLVADTSVRVAVVLSSIVGRSCQCSVMSEGSGAGALGVQIESLISTP